MKSSFLIIEFSFWSALYHGKNNSWLFVCRHNETCHRMTKYHFYTSLFWQTSWCGRFYFYVYTQINQYNIFSFFFVLTMHLDIHEAYSFAFHLTTTYDKILLSSTEMWEERWEMKNVWNHNSKEKLNKKIKNKIMTDERPGQILS